MRAKLSSYLRSLAYNHRVLLLTANSYYGAAYKALLQQYSLWERAVAGVYCARQRIITLFRSRGQASSPITSPVSNRCWATTKHQKL